MISFAGFGLFFAISANDLLPPILEFAGDSKGLCRFASVLEETEKLSKLASLANAVSSTDTGCCCCGGCVCSCVSVMLANPFIVKAPNAASPPPIVFSSGAGVNPEKSGGGEPNPKLEGVCCACGVTAGGTAPPLNASYGCVGMAESYGFSCVVIGAGGVHELLVSVCSGFPYGLAAVATVAAYGFVDGGTGAAYGLAGTGGA